MNKKDLKNFLLQFDCIKEKMLKEINDKLLSNKDYAKTLYNYTANYIEDIELEENKIYLYCHLKSQSSRHFRAFWLPLDVLENPHWHLKVIIEKNMRKTLMLMMNDKGIAFSKLMQELNLKWER